MCPDGPGLGVDEERSLCAKRMGGMGTHKFMERAGGNYSLVKNLCM